MNRIAAARTELSEALRFLDMVPPNCWQHMQAAIEHAERANRLLDEGTNEGTKP
jgi:outer membrane murein-binding lipoprotein Lpp